MTRVPSARSLSLLTFATPPAAGLTKLSGKGETHAHNVTISAADLARVAAGQEVKIKSAPEDGHTHTFTIVKVAS